MATAHRPRKRFGQHFLHDPAVIERIVAALAPQPGQRIVEIGPGEGAITGAILRRCGALDAVEIDRDLAASLATRLAGSGELRIHTADALRFNYASLAAGDSRLRIVGNLPYNISTPLMFRLLEQTASIADMHFMLQQEVVDRMGALPGTRAYGRLTVMLAPLCRVEPLFRIGPGAFRPPPRVQSAFVRLTPYTDPPFPLPDPEAFARLVAQAFTMRRKTLRNALRGLADVACIEAAGIDPSTRPDTLSPADYARLSATAPL